MRLGLVSFCHDGYPKEELSTWFTECAGLFSRAEIFSAGLVCTGAEAKEKAVMFINVDAVVVICLSAFPSVDAVDFLMPYIEKPILLWHVPARDVTDRKLTLGASAAGFSSLRYPLAKLGANRMCCFSGKTDSGETVRFINDWLCAMRAFCGLRGSRVGMAGYSDLGFYTGTFDHLSLKRIFGAEVVHIPLTEVIKELNTISPMEAEEPLNLITTCQNAGELPSELLLNTAKSYAALKRILSRYSLDALSLKCFEGFTANAGFTPCMALSLLAEKFPVSCKCDMHAMLSVQALSLVSGETAAFFELYDLVNGNLLMANCGMSPQNHIEGKRKLDRFTWGGIDGVIDASTRKQGPVTLLRFDKDEGNNYFCHTLAASAKLPPAWMELGWSEPAPNFPSLEIDTNGPAFLINSPGQHYALCYGDYSGALALLAKMLGIKQIAGEGNAK